MDLRSILMGMAFVIMWSSAFTSARMIVADAPPLTALALRFLLLGLIGVGLPRLMGQRWHLTPYQCSATEVVGICHNALYLGLNLHPIQHVEA